MTLRCPGKSWIAKFTSKQLVSRSQGIPLILKIHDAGNGKTHYIKKQLANCSDHVTIAINEAFCPLTAIHKLRSLPLYKKDIGLFFNFTILPPGVSAAIVNTL